MALCSVASFLSLSLSRSLPFCLLLAAVAVNETQSAELTLQFLPSAITYVASVPFICLASSRSLSLSLHFSLPCSLARCQAQIAFSPSRTPLFTLFLPTTRVTSSRQPSDTRFLYRRQRRQHCPRLLILYQLFARLSPPSKELRPSHGQSIPKCC